MTGPTFGAFAVFEQVLAAVRTIDGLRVHDDPGEVVDPPAAVLLPPAFTWDGYLSDPTGATVTLALVAPSNDRALRTLLGYLPAVVAAVDGVPDAVVRSAAPGVLADGPGTDLPAYLIEIEVIP